MDENIVLNDEDVELLPCPFCGSAAHLIYIEEWPDCGKPKTYYGIGCNTFECYGEAGKAYFETKIAAIKAWNTRNGKINND